MTEGPAPTEMKLLKRDLADLRRAKRLLERQSLIEKIAYVVGTPIEVLIKIMPEPGKRMIQTVTRNTLEKCLDAALATIGKAPPGPATENRHSLLAIAAGGVGGVAGFPGLAVELPITTSIMLRSIADIARSEGADITSIETQMECLSVFALGGKLGEDSAAETSYYAVRAALARTVGNAAKQIAEHGLSAKSAPAAARLVTRIAQRYGVQVGEKALSQSVPLIGAVGGAAINGLFIAYFQRIARGHFIVKRLERKYGRDIVEKAYKKGVQRIV